MRSFSHVETPLRVFSGADCLTKLERELSRLGASRAVIVTGGTLSRGPLVAMIRDAMGARCAGVYAGVKAHTPRSGVEEAAAELSRLNADAVVAVGGGSAVVTARAASIYLAEGNDLDALCTRRDDSGRMISPRLGADKIPQVVIPTTPNTAMVKAGSAVFDEAAGARKALFDPKTRAQSIFVHPDLLMSAPQGLVVSAALDSFTLGIEGLLSKSGDAMSDAALMHAIRLLGPALRIMDGADGADLRADLAMAAILCGRGTDHAGAGAGTVLGHAIGANHEVENGIAKAVLMPHVLRFNAGHATPSPRCSKRAACPKSWPIWASPAPIWTTSPNAAWTTGSLAATRALSLRRTIWCRFSTPHFEGIERHDQSLRPWRQPRKASFSKVAARCCRLWLFGWGDWWQLGARGARGGVFVAPSRTAGGQSAQNGAECVLRHPAGGSAECRCGALLAALRSDSRSG